MNTNILQTLVSKTPPSNILIPSKPSTTTTTKVTQNLLKVSYFGRSITISPINSTSGSSNTSSDGNDAPQPVTPPITPETVKIQFRRRSRRQRQKEEGSRDNRESFTKVQALGGATNVTKNWEDMSLTEKAIELYMGEKGMLFWLNKFAYASIFIMIGAWILFRFVGPSLDLYQLDTPPLSPSSILKG